MLHALAFVLALPPQAPDLLPDQAPPVESPLPPLKRRVVSGLLHGPTEGGDGTVFIRRQPQDPYPQTFGTDARTLWVVSGALADRAAFRRAATHRHPAHALVVVRPRSYGTADEVHLLDAPPAPEAAPVEAPAAVPASAPSPPAAPSFFPTAFGAFRGGGFFHHAAPTYFGGFGGGAVCGPQGCFR